MSGSPDLVIRTFGSLAAAEARLAELTHCTGCEQLLYDEVIYRRAYNLAGVIALVVFCASCNNLIAPNSAADQQFLRRLKRMSDAAAKAGRKHHLIIPGD